MNGSITNSLAEAPPLETLSDLVERYCVETVLRPASQQNYWAVIRLFHRDTGIADPRHIRREDVLAWRNALLERASAHTWNTYRRHLKSLLNFAVRRDWLAENPFHSVGPAYGDRRKKTVAKPHLAEALRLLKSDHAPIHPGWFWGIVLKVLLYTGSSVFRDGLIKRSRPIDFATPWRPNWPKATVPT